MSMQLLLIRVYVEFKKPNTLKKSVSAVYSCIQKRGGRRPAFSARHPLFCWLIRYLPDINFRPNGSSSAAQERRLQFPSVHR